MLPLLMPSLVGPLDEYVCNQAVVRRGAPKGPKGKSAKVSIPGARRHFVQSMLMMFATRAVYLFTCIPVYLHIQIPAVGQGTLTFAHGSLSRRFGVSTFAIK